MKKILRFIIFIFAFVSLTNCCIISKSSSHAVSYPSLISNSDFTKTTKSIIYGFSSIKNRIAGSVGEREASQYIKEYLNYHTTLDPLNNQYVKEGIQEFSYESNFSGIYQNSQNVIFELKAKNKTNKKIIIGCHYDAVAYDLDINSENYGNFIDSESINGSAGSVALLLALAEYSIIPNDYNIEFVFFGAGEDGKAGSKYYTSGISDEEKENILCMINVSQIAYGNNLYFYMDEIKTKTSNYIEDVIYENNVKIDQIDVVHLNKSFYSDDELGLGYTHVALDSDNVNFMKEGIQTINMFSGDYNDGIIIGRQEFSGEDLITYTANDNREHIYFAKPEHSIEGNLYQIYKGINYIINDSNFVQTFESSQGSTDMFYMIFANNNLIKYLTVVIFVIIVVIAMFVYYKLSVKAYNANVETEFLSSVVKISDQIDSTGNDQNVAKVVSQVIANDIKKDKVIKVKSKKDKT